MSYMKALPRDSAPGTKVHDNTGETDLAGILVANAVGKSPSQHVSEKLWQAYGMERDATWLLDVAGHERGGCCLFMTVGDHARHRRSPMAHRRRATGTSGGSGRAALTRRPASSASRSPSFPTNAW